MASLTLPEYTGGAQVLATHPQQKKTSVALSPSSPHPLIAHIVLVALVPKPWFLVPVFYVPVQVPVVGTQCPVGPVCVFPRSHSPMVVGLCSVILYRRFWVPLHQSPISTCPAGLPQALSPATHLPIFFLDGTVILLLCHKSITPLLQLSWLKVLACLLNLILCLGFFLQFNLSCLPELAQLRAYATQFSPFTLHQ